jgi:hypothetical protein
MTDRPNERLSDLLDYDLDEDAYERDEFDDGYALVDDVEDEARFWTPRRILLAIVLGLALLSLLAYDFAPIFDFAQPPVPTPVYGPPDMPLI